MALLQVDCLTRAVMTPRNPVFDRVGIQAGFQPCADEDRRQTIRDGGHARRVAVADLLQQRLRLVA